MKKIIFILLLSMYMIGCNSNTVKTSKNTVIESSSPTHLLDLYYGAIKSGDEDLMNKLFIGDKGLILEKPIPNISYRIVASRVITEQEALLRNQTTSKNILKEGDLEVFVEENINGNSEEITFIFRKINNKWLIYSHSLGYYI